MRRTPIACAAALVLALAACGTVPEGERPWWQFEPSFARNDVESLLQYQGYIRRLTPAELNRERDTVGQALARNKSDYSRLQLALLYGLPNVAGRDEARALSLIEPLVRENGQKSALRNFAVFLHGWLSENRRLSESAQVLTQKLKEELKQNEALQHKLEALKSIEKSLSERDQTKVPETRK